MFSNVLELIQTKHGKLYVLCVYIFDYIVFLISRERNHILCGERDMFKGILCRISLQNNE